MQIALSIKEEINIKKSQKLQKIEIKGYIIFNYL